MTLHTKTIFLIAASVLIVCLPSAGAQQAGSEDGRRRVLILNSYHKEFQWTDNQVAGAREVLSEEAGSLELYVEYMDTKRIYTEEYLAQLVTTYHLKYDNIKLDAVIATDDNALRFVMDHHQEVFQGAPTSFCGINDYPSFLLEGKEHFTGLVEVLDIEATIDLALKLHPRTRKVYVIVDSTPTGIGQLRDVASAARKYGELEFEYLKGEDYSTAELLEQLPKFPQDSIVLLTVWLRDKNDDYAATDEVGALISATSSVPVYGIIDMYLGHGIVGGRLLNSETHGRMAAEMAVRILKGEKPSNIRVLVESYNPYMFDDTQLRRWGIDPADLPEDSIVINRSFSLYETYQSQIWSVAGAFAFLLATIAILVSSVMRRRQAEEALRESEERALQQLAELEQIYDTSPIGLSLVDADLRYVHINEHLAAMNGKSVAEHIGCTVMEMLPELADKLEPIYRHVIETQEAVLDSELQGTTKAAPGTVRHWLVSYLPLTSEETHVHGVLAVVSDITERKLAEEERQQLEAQMQQTQKLESLGVMAGGIAHDFNNILYAILGNADIALDEMPPEAVGRDCLQEIQTAARRASGLTDQMLAYSGKGALAIEEMDLSGLVQEMSHLLEVSHTKKAIVKYRFEEKLSAIEGDASQLRQVVMNLITNASEAVGEEGGFITVETGVTEATQEYLATTYTHDELPGGCYVYLEVTDTGCGMDEETQKRMFEPFFTTKFTGRGLGMAAVLGIVRAHKGAIDIQSEIDRGTTIKVLFPALDGPARPPSEEAPQQEDWSAHGTVLVVDDEPQIRNLLKLVLERKGFTVLTADDGRQATEVFGEHRDEIACVLLDLTMPHMGGEETYVELCQIREDIPVILVSGYSEEELEERVENLGFAGFLKKPVRSKALLDRVRAVLNLSEGM